MQMQPMGMMSPMGQQQMQSMSHQQQPPPQQQQQQPPFAQMAPKPMPVTTGKVCLLNSKLKEINANAQEHSFVEVKVVDTQRYVIAGSGKPQVFA
jgi:hypothetical protein